MRGVTLIEMMITVAIIGISVIVAGNAARSVRSDGLAELQRERAAEILEYQAGRLASGQPISQATMKQLTANLPGARVVQQREKTTTKLVVRWDAPSGLKQSRSLVIFTHGKK